MWDNETEERERLKKEREKDKPEDWDAPEAQTDPGNGLTWDEMVPKDHGVAPSWVEAQEREQLEMNLPWRCDPEGRETQARGGESERSGREHPQQSGTAS